MTDRQFQRTLEIALTELVVKEIITVNKQLQRIERRLKKLMGQTDDLSAAIDQLDADTKALADKQTQAFADLEKAVADGKTGNDLTPFITRLQNNHAAMVQALADAQAADDTTKTP
jgi:predicted  nucleic acid-binding Zn-ribbon protein